MSGDLHGRLAGCFGAFPGDEEPARHDRPIRLGIVGAPRAEKDVQAVLDAFATTTRPDLELHVWSLRGDETVPDDPRIHAEAYPMVDRSDYDGRLRSLDALVLPFHESDMITTGTVGDLIGAGIAGVTSGWGYLAEALGDAAIPFGDDLVGTLETLDRERLAASAEAARRLRADAPRRPSPRPTSSSSRRSARPACSRQFAATGAVAHTGASNPAWKVPRCAPHFPSA